MKGNFPHSMSDSFSQSDTPSSSFSNLSSRLHLIFIILFLRCLLFISHISVAFELLLLFFGCILFFFPVIAQAMVLQGLLGPA